MITFSGLKKEGFYRVREREELGMCCYVDEFVAKDPRDLGANLIKLGEAIQSNISNPNVLVSNDHEKCFQFIFGNQRS